MRTWSKIGFFLCLAALSAYAEAAPPKGKTAPSLPKVDADALPPGRFIGTIVSAPNSDRMFTLKITYPEVRLKPGAKMPNLRNVHAQNMHRQYQQMMNLHHQMGRGGRHPIHNVMQMQQMYMQMQMNQQRAIARMQQQELRLLQQEIKAIQSMYQVVPVTRDFDFQADANVKVRIKNLPEPFDEKGNIKKYTPEELAALKGKDKNLIGYESSVEALHPGQVVMVALRAHKKPQSRTLATPAAKKDKDDDKEVDSSIEHKMQVTMIVILKDSDTLQNAASASKQKKK